MVLREKPTLEQLDDIMEGLRPLLADAATKAGRVADSPNLLTINRLHKKCGAYAGGQSGAHPCLLAIEEITGATPTMDPGFGRSVLSCIDANSRDQSLI